MRQLIIITFLALQILPAQFLSIQGVARDNSGISLANGGYSFEFKLYVEETNGTAVWTEIQVLTVVNGVFSANLGIDESMAGLDYNTEYWLGISINSNAELSPRGKLTLSPYAVMAQVFGTSNVFPQDGNVGIGTTSPQAKLDVNGNMLLSGPWGQYRNFGLSGGNSHGYLYGNFPELGDGIHIGYNYYVNSNNEHVIPATGGGTSRISMKYGELDFATGNINENPTSKMFINIDGNVGIGTTTPQAKLDVNGEVKVGGQKPIVLRKFWCGPGFTSEDTGYPVSQWVAAVAGFHAMNGDINEGGVQGTIIQVEAVSDRGANWVIVADFASHGTGEDWVVSVLFVDRRMADIIGY